MLPLGKVREESGHSYAGNEGETSFLFKKCEQGFNAKREITYLQLCYRWESYVRRVDIPMIGKKEKRHSFSKKVKKNSMHGGGSRTGSGTWCNAS